MGQTWACASEPNWFRRRDSFGGTSFQKRVVYCDVDNLDYAAFGGKGRPTKCTLFGVECSWDRCSECPSNRGIRVMANVIYPLPIPGACRKGDLSFQVGNPTCDYCSEKMPCIQNLFASGRKRRLRLVST